MQPAPAWIIPRTKKNKERLASNKDAKEGPSDGVTSRFLNRFMDQSQGRQQVEVTSATADGLRLATHQVTTGAKRGSQPNTSNTNTGSGVQCLCSDPEATLCTATFGTVIGEPEVRWQWIPMDVDPGEPISIPVPTTPGVSISGGQGCCDAYLFIPHSKALAFLLQTCLVVPLTKLFELFSHPRFLHFVRLATPNKKN